MSRRSKWPSSVACLAAVLAGGLVAACGSSSESSTPSAAKAVAAGASKPAWLEQVEARVAESYEGVGMSVPTTGPEAVAGKRIWDVACNLTAPNCKAASDGVVAAGETLGWKVTTVDSGSNPVKAAQFVMQAVAAKADGIVITAIDCSAIKGALTAAKEAGIATISLGSQDCAPALFTAGTSFAGEPTYMDGITGPFAQMRLDWAIAESGGNLRMITMNIPDYSVLVQQTAAVREHMKVCPTCEIVKQIDIPFASLENAGQLLSAAFAQHPEANAVYLVDSSFLQLGAKKAIESAGRAVGDDQLIVIGAGGDSGEAALVRDGWNIGFPSFTLNWNAWQAVDFLNRVFSGAKPSELPTGGVGLQLVDRDHNLPAGDAWKPPVDYQAAYKKVWGVS